jgi:hypothetical protein
MDVAVGAAVPATAAATARRMDGLCAALLLLAGTSLCMQVFCSGKWGARPSTEDEFVYLFQAKTLAAGHLTMPSPPLPGFFEAAHLLVTPRFAAKYLPGHAALIAPFQAAGVPWLAPCLLFGATAALLFAAARLAGLPLWAALLASILLLGNTDVFPFFASYLSQSTSVAAAAAVVALGIAADRDPTAGRIAGLFAAIVFAGLTRPFAGVAALVTGAAVLYRIRGRAPLRTMAWALPPLLAGALAVGAICKATTGSWTIAPWSLYARQYMPFDGPGIGSMRHDPPERELPPHLRDLHVGFEQSRARHTLARLPSETWKRVALVARLLPSWMFVVALIGLAWTPIWPAAVFALAFFLLQLTFHFRAPIYYLEMTPWLCLSAAAGAAIVGRGIERLRRRPLAMGAAVLAGLAALWVGVAMFVDLRPVISRAAERPWPYARWEPAFDWLRQRHALVFIRYPARWDGNADLTYNDPDLQRADVVRAIDQGERNAALLPYFPGRPAFVLDPVTLRVEQIR